MFSKYSTRREFVRFGILSSLLFLNSCSNSSNRVKIALVNSFYPDSFQDTIPNEWLKENIHFGTSHTDKNIISNFDFTLINDGWISSINFNEFQSISEPYLVNKLDKRSENLLKNFQENQRKRLFPIGVIPYGIIIKNNKDLISSASESWDFLLSRKLTKKIILPQSPRIIISIAEKINAPNSLARLKSQAMIFDDQNSLNWLINSDACVAIIPYSLCLKYLKIDSRLSIVFPKQGVPLMWHFILARSKNNSAKLIRWIKSLDSEVRVDKLLNQGWYLPFNNEYSQSNYKAKISRVSGPSKSCWDNSWSLPSLNNEQKIKLENYWNESLIP